MTPATGASDGGVSVRHSSDNPSFGTPPEVFEPARLTLGKFDLDPASSLFANVGIRASKIFTFKDNGFTKPWSGRTILNPPGGKCDAIGQLVLEKTKTRRPCVETGACGLPVGHKHLGVQSSQRAWWFKLVDEYLAGRVTQAIFVCFSVELLQTTQSKGRKGSAAAALKPLQLPICYPSKRVAYLRDDGTPGKSPPHSSCLVFLPPRVDDMSAKLEHVRRFASAFKPLGEVVVPASYLGILL